MPATLALHLPPGRCALIESLLDSAFRNGHLHQSWTIVESDAALVAIGVNTAAGSPAEALWVRLHDPEGQRSTTLGWPLSALTLTQLLNGLTRAWDSVGATVAVTPTAEAHRLLESWVAESGVRGDELGLVIGTDVVATLSLATDTWRARETMDPQVAATRWSTADARWRRDLPADAGLVRAGSVRRLLWAWAGLASPHGLLTEVAQSPALTLRGWPYLIAQGPAVWGECARFLHLQQTSASRLLEHHHGQYDTVVHFLNGCFVTGYMRAAEPLAQARGVAILDRPPAPGPSRLTRALGSIRRALGMGGQEPGVPS